jgi:hypothetical protein
MMNKTTDYELNYIKQNFKTMLYKDIAININRSIHFVRNTCWKMGWRKKPNYEWTTEELEYLKEQYKAEFIDLDKIAGILKRHKTNISRKARELGLTNICRQKSKIHCEKIKENTGNWYKKHEHPRGFLGHKHTKSSKIIMGQKSQRNWDDPTSYLNSEENKQRISDNMIKSRLEGKLREGYSRGNMGKRADLNGLYVRSSWEANYARYLNWLVIQEQIRKWEYEADTFVFEAIKRGTRSYLPDFKITNMDGTIEYHEVKGWMDQKSKTKLARMTKYYPGIKLILIGKDEYYAIKKSIKGFIPNWE